MISTVDLDREVIAASVAYALLGTWGAAVPLGVIVAFLVFGVIGMLVSMAVGFFRAPAWQKALVFALVGLSCAVPLLGLVVGVCMFALRLAQIGGREDLHDLARPVMTLWCAPVVCGLLLGGGELVALPVLYMVATFIFGELYADEDDRYSPWKVLAVAAEVPGLLVGLGLSAWLLTHAAAAHSAGGVSTGASHGANPGPAPTAGASPGIEHVAGHVRTIPDGNPYNNLSYPGGPVQSPPPVIEVQGYVRSIADGNPLNNLSSPAAAMPQQAVPASGLTPPVPPPPPVVGWRGSLAALMSTPGATNSSASLRPTYRVVTGEARWLLFRVFVAVAALGLVLNGVELTRKVFFRPSSPAAGLAQAPASGSGGGSSESPVGGTTVEASTSSSATVAPTSTAPATPPTSATRDVAIPGGGSRTVEVDHPSWGAVRVVVTAAGDGHAPGPAAIQIFDSHGEVRFAYRSEFMYEFDLVGGGGRGEAEGLAGPVDGAGHVFIRYNPGRYDGVIVLGFVDDGVDDFGTLPSGTSSGRFYAGRTIDVDADGIYEVETSVNDCKPGCARGSVTRTNYWWNGSSYEPRAG